MLPVSLPAFVDRWVVVVVAGDSAVVVVVGGGGGGDDGHWRQIQFVCDPCQFQPSWIGVLLLLLLVVVVVAVVVVGTGGRATSRVIRYTWIFFTYH